MSVRRQLDAREIELTAQLLSALDSELRLSLLFLLNRDARVVHQLVTELGKSQPLISQHLRVLKAAGLVTSRRTGREVVYSLAQPGIVDVIMELATYASPGASAFSSVSATMSSASAVAIIEPPMHPRPGEDPGLYPQTPKPQRD
ncbi:metalloregulator ArsR/SmtB family transcription factor [Corynebacterium sp. Q4381]|uniref:ArsR/SmtB family transcription factor n=1 Tax=Corynebacterium sp. Marseille-Q4381 TaxID=3121597 RepID=UPI002FE69A8D